MVPVKVVKDESCNIATVSNDLSVSFPSTKVAVFSAVLIVGSDTL